MKIVVLAGGLSTERVVSLVTGSSVCRALRENGHRAILVDLFLGMETLPEDARLDLALRALSRSLSSLEAVEEVRFLVDGEFATHYGGVSLTTVYFQN